MGRAVVSAGGETPDGCTGSGIRSRLVPLPVSSRLMKIVEVRKSVGAARYRNVRAR